MFRLKQPFLPPAFPTSPTALPPCVFYPKKSSPKQKNTKEKKVANQTKIQESQIVKRERRTWTDKRPIVKVVSLRDLSEGKIRTKRRESQTTETNSSFQKEEVYQQKKSGEIKARSQSLKVIHEKDTQNLVKKGTFQN